MLLNVTIHQINDLTNSGKDRLVELNLGQGHKTSIRKTHPVKSANNDYEYEETFTIDWEGEPQLWLYVHEKSLFGAKLIARTAVPIAEKLGRAAKCTVTYRLEPQIPSISTNGSITVSLDCPEFKLVAKKNPATKKSMLCC